MSTELQESDDVETAPSAFEELLAAEDECGAFFGGVFDELQSLSLELFARHHSLETGGYYRARGAAAESSAAACRDDLHRAIEHFQQCSKGLETQLARLSATHETMKPQARAQSPPIAPSCGQV